jgi:hypothetical protein
MSDEFPRDLGELDARISADVSAITSMWADPNRSR